MRRRPLSHLGLCLAGLLLPVAGLAQTLTGWARMPAASFADGPSAGQFAAANPWGTHRPPFPSQPVQGFSAVLASGRDDVFHFLVDNGFGAQGNSRDALLRAYAVRIDWRTATGGSGRVQPVDWRRGDVLPGFDSRSRIELDDAQHRLGLPIEAEQLHHGGDPAQPKLDPTLRERRLLTGADFDPESFQRDRRGHFWFGDEFGPYLLNTDARGRVLQAPISLPGVYSPQHAAVRRGQASANLPASGGFEGMAICPDGRRLFTLLERPVTGDPEGTLRFNEFDLERGAWSERMLRYRLHPEGTHIGDLVAVDDSRFLVIERNASTATAPDPPPFKRVFLVDSAGVPDGGELHKRELLDLMRLDDPDDLDGDGQRQFQFPYVTIENLLLLDAQTLLVANDNNFPYGGGRRAAADDTEFLRIRLPEPLRAQNTQRTPR